MGSACLSLWGHAIKEPSGSLRTEYLSIAQFHGRSFCFMPKGDCTKEHVS